MYALSLCLRRNSKYLVVPPSWFGLRQPLNRFPISSSLTACLHWQSQRATIATKPRSSLFPNSSHRIPRSGKSNSTMANEKDDLVLVTGGSGFLGAHCIVQLLNAGYRVRTTIRSPKREDDIRAMLLAGNVMSTDRLTVVIADLTKDDGWQDAVKTCSYILHVASPFPLGAPKHEDDLIIPAREGTLRVLRAAQDAGVKRVVVTSSFASIGYGHQQFDKPFTEEIWTNLSSSDVKPYIKSKTLAERAAWDFIEKEGGSLELSVINPTAIYGPILGQNFATSIVLVQRLLNGTIPGCPQLTFGVVDVRDVADLHLRAMIDPKAKGERFLAVSPPAISVQEMSLALRKELGDVAKRAPTRVLPNFLLQLGGMLSPDLALLTPELGKKKEMSNAKARDVLGWNPRTSTEAIVATAESLIRFGLVKKL